MGFGIGGNADFEIGDIAQAFDKIRRIGIAAGMRRVAVCIVGCIATQRDDVANAVRPVPFRYTVHFFPGGTDAG